MTRSVTQVHHRALAHQFDDLEQQREAATLGMWVFLVTEVLFFGVLFATYAVYRAWYPDAFAAASHELHIWPGTINTAVLITSSLTMALAVHAAQTGERRRLMMFLVADDGSRRGVSRHQGIRVLHGLRRAPSARRRSFSSKPEYFQHAQIFFSLYFMMTGLHARAHDHRAGRHGRHAVAVVARHDHRRVLQPDRDQRALLALRRHRVDLPVSAAVSDRRAHGLTHSSLRRRRVYYTIFGILMLCTYLTVQMAFIDLGAFNTVAALVIAVFKATIVVLFFMHVKYSSRLTWVVVSAACSGWEFCWC